MATDTKTVLRYRDLGVVPWEVRGSGWANSGWIMLTEIMYDGGATEVVSTYVYDQPMSEEGERLTAPPELYPIRRIAQEAHGAAMSHLSGSVREALIARHGEALLD